jgi:hypothetical protein
MFANLRIFHKLFFLPERHVQVGSRAGPAMSAQTR